MAGRCSRYAANPPRRRSCFAATAAGRTDRTPRSGGKTYRSAYAAPLGATSIGQANNVSRDLSKPLWIPLRREWFIAFRDGGKGHEWRLYGPRWNEDSCFIGRPVTLALGY